MLDQHDATHAAVGFGGKKDWEQSDGDWHSERRRTHSTGYGDEPVFKWEIGSAKAAGETITVTGWLRH